MAMFCQNMLEIAVEIAAKDTLLRRHGHKIRRPFPVDRPRHEQVGTDGMWDEEDGFYYDVLRLSRWRRVAFESPLPGGPAATLCHRGH